MHARSPRPGLANPADTTRPRARVGADRRRLAQGPHHRVADRLAFRGNREVRHTIVRVITIHLRQDAAVSWQGADLDFTGVVFDGGNFVGAQFSGSLVTFDQAQFSGGLVRFGYAEFSGGKADFSSAADWSHPPRFNWHGTPPAGIKLPAAEGSESQ